MTQPPKSAPPSSNFEVPDLDLGALPQVRRPLPARSQSGAHAVNLPARGPGTHEPQAFLGTTVASLDDDFELDEAMTFEAAVVPTVDTRPWPLGRSSEPKRGLLTPESIAERARYGDPDVQFYLAPAYTWRVWNQRRALTRAIQSHERELGLREAERDQLLVELAVSLKGALQKQDRFREILAELASTSQAFEGRERALASTNAAIDQQLDVHTAELARLEIERAERAQPVQIRQNERDTKAVSHQRASAKLKRVQIEIRNVTDKGRALLGPQGGTLPANLAQQLSELSTAEAALTRELAPFTAELDQANAALQAAEAPLAETLRAMDAVRQKHRQLLDGTRKQVASESSEVKGAEAAHTEVAKRIAIAVLDLKGSIPVDRTALDRIQHADDRADAALLETERLRLALDAYDRPTYGLGLKLAIAPFAFMLALILLRIIL